MAKITAIIACCLVFCVSIDAAATTYSVCASGCDYTTIQAGVNAASSSDIVEIRDSGTYLEQVSRTTGGITIQAQTGQTPIIDAENSRASCILAYTTWTIKGITCRNTTSHGITGNGGNRTYSAYDLVIHDIGGDGITGFTSSGGTPEVSRLLIYDTTGNGISSGASMDITNVMVYGAGDTAIQATGSSAAVSHCTVYGGSGGAYCIQATGASGAIRYSVAHSCYGATSGIRGTGITAYNNVYDVQGGGTAYYLDAPGSGDTTADSQLVAPGTDFRPAAGSPLIDAATGSSQTLDLLGLTRVGTPDKGAYEYIPTVSRPFSGGAPGLMFDGGVVTDWYSNGF